MLFRSGSGDQVREDGRQGPAVPWTVRLAPGSGVNMATDPFNTRQGAEFVGHSSTGRGLRGADPVPTNAMFRPQADHVLSDQAAPEPEGIGYVSPGRSPGNAGQQDSRALEGRHSAQARRNHQRRQARRIRVAGSRVSADAGATLSHPSGAPDSWATCPGGSAALRPGLELFLALRSGLRPHSLWRLRGRFIGRYSLTQTALV